MPTSPDLNEFLFNPDTDEFIEIKGDPDTDYGAYSIIVVDGDRSSATSNNAGIIDNVFRIGTTNAAGYWATPLQSNTLQNGTQTVLIVRNFTGRAGADLDPGDTGMLGGAAGSVPWDAVVSAFAVNDGDRLDLTYTTPAAIGATDGLTVAVPVLTGARLLGASRIPDGQDTGSVSDWMPNDPSLAGLPGYAATPAAGDALNTPGAANSTGVPAATGTTVTIQALNGDSYASPYKGQAITTTGIVTAVDGNGSIGFWLQDPDSAAGNNIGSHGIFVYSNSASKLPAVGDLVSVSGTMTDYVATGSSASRAALDSLGMPEITTPTTTVISHNQAQPGAVVLGIGGETPPDVIYQGTSDNLNNSTATLAPGTNALDFYRALQGQIVTIHDARVVGATAGNATFVVPGGVGTLDSRGGIIETATSPNTQRIEIYTDTGVKGVSGVTQSGFTAQVGDTLGDVTGVLTYYNGVFELEPTAAVTVTQNHLAQQTSTLHADDTHMLVADYNIENMDALLASNASRVAQLASIIAGNLDNPDVLALQEVQDDSGTTNDGTVSAANNIAAIIRAIASAGGPTYAYAEIDPANNTEGGVPGGNIRNVFLYNPDRVSLVGDVGLIGAADSTTVFRSTRLPLVGTFRLNTTGQQVTLVNVHNTSQAGGDGEYASVQSPFSFGSSDPYGATGTNAVPNTRQTQAQEITGYVNQLLAGQPDAKVAVLGDFNDVDWSSAQRIYATGGLLTDLNLKEAADQRYTYDFGGNSESLDHTLGSTALYDASQFQTVHVNAEFPDATRESDHDPSVTLIDMFCFLSGTLIATTPEDGNGADVGEVAIETLLPGDLVLTASGASRPVRWIGTGTVDLDALYGSAVPLAAHPVRVRRDAIAAGQPARDLLLTPEHCLALDGGLVPVRMLVNGRTILHDRDLRRFTVFHLELDSHDVVLANGVEAESWLDTGNRDRFSNTPVTQMRPDFETVSCSPALAAPLLTDRATVEPIWRRLDARADLLRHPPRMPAASRTADPALAVRLADGGRIDAVAIAPGEYELSLPAGSAVRSLVSRYAVPAEVEGPFVDDRRRLGVAVAQILLETDTGEVAITREGRGWHAMEQDGALCWNWTNGAAALMVEAVPIARRLLIRLQASLNYPVVTATGAATLAA